MKSYTPSLILVNNFFQAFGTAAEALENFLIRGIINWGNPVTSLLEDGQLYIQQARATEASGKDLNVPILFKYEIL